VQRTLQDISMKFRSQNHTLREKYLAFVTICDQRNIVDTLRGTTIVHISLVPIVYFFDRTINIIIITNIIEVTMKLVFLIIITLLCNYSHKY